MVRSALAGLAAIIAIPCLLYAGPTIPGVYGNIAPTLRSVSSTQLPVLKQGGLLYGASQPTTSGNVMTINQTQSQAVIDWSTFNIGSAATVNFNQANSSWAALNRIWDNQPSQIYGAINASGKIYLINQNGILFGQGSQVNVGSLTASSLSIGYTDFLNGTLHFTATDYNGQGINNTFYSSLLPGSVPGPVSNLGTITAASGGSVFLIGPTVENGGYIYAPSGQIGLVAGTDIVLEVPPSGTTYLNGETRTTLAVQVNNSDGGYTATNLPGGYLSADMGLVGMYGNIVNQNGVIHSVTGVQNGAHVELFASDTITTGANSLIYLPVSGSSEEISSTFTTMQSDVTFSGLDPGQPWSPRAAYYPSLIVHNGAIIAPSGTVTMNATSRVYLGSGSLIDVSGLWLTESADDALISVQLDTYNLRDYYLQKGGVLEGTTITTSDLTGSAIGDMSEAYTTEEQTAAERHTTGGKVDINVTGSTGDIIVMQGATINFSGGGIVYEPGTVNTTKLVSGYKVYDIDSASAYYTYNSILNSQSFTNARFGITTSFDGVYYGGIVPVNEYSPGYTVGSAAGTLWLDAATVVLDGAIYGSATNGLQQTLTSSSTSNAAYIAVAGGTLQLGGPLTSTSSKSDADDTDFMIDSITVAAQTSPLPASFGPKDTLPSSVAGTAVVSSATLSNGGLSAVALYANKTITVGSGAQVTLAPGGTFNATARRIENYGAIAVPGGTISLTLQPDMTNDPSNPRYDGSVGERIYLAPGSSLSVAGQKIDDAGSAVYSGIVTSGHLAGGSIGLSDDTVDGEGVIVSPGAIIDVSGGYQIASNGKATGGNAGGLTLQGYSVVLEGDLRGYSLVGYTGGSLSVTAYNIDVAASGGVLPAGFAANDALSSNLQGQFILGAHQLDATGFTGITLNSVNNIAVEGGITLSPSLVKLATPSLTGAAQGYVPGVSTPASQTPSVFTAPWAQIGTSKISLIANASTETITGTSDQNGPMNTPNTSAAITISSGSSLAAAPGGTISLNAPYVDISGSLSAPSGAITVTGGLALTLESGAALLAEGYNKQPVASSGITWLAPSATPEPGGTIALSAESLNLLPNSLVSVDGSSPVVQSIVNSDLSISSIVTAAAPGSIVLSSPGQPTLAGTLRGRAKLAGLPGGTLSITQSGTSEALSYAMTDLARFRDEGFDALTLSSAYQLNITGSGQVAFGRQLTLDAPVITDSNNAGSDHIVLFAPYIQVEAVEVENVQGSLPPASSVTSGNASITLEALSSSGGFLDVTGSVLFSGFNSVTLSASNDIRLSGNSNNASTVSTGYLGVAGDLTLQAARVYPTTLSSFTIDTTYAPVPYGKVTILSSGGATGGPIDSAGGSLTVNAAGGFQNGIHYGGIDQEGYLAAPMGSIVLNSTNGRVYLGPGSTTTTKGSVSVEYGSIEYGSNSSDTTSTLGDNEWTVSGISGAVQSAPTGSVSLKGAEVIVRDGATVDVSGSSGGVFASTFVPSYSGTNNPLTGSYVVLPGVVLPGSAVYLTGVNGLAAGVYSLLPALDSSGNPTTYVYLPGALIVTSLGTSISPTAAHVYTSDGYPVAAGYATTTGTGAYSTAYTEYEVRPASVVLAEGSFDFQSFTAGNAGSVTITGSTTIVGGTIRANALSGYSSGSFAVSGSTSAVLYSTIPLPTDFGFYSAVPSNLSNKLNVAASAVSGQGLNTVGIGVSDLSGSAASTSANTIEVMPGVILEAENIILGARTSIRLDAGAQILALAAAGDTGQTTFVSGYESSGNYVPGTLTIGANVLVRASDAVNIQTGALNLDPTATLTADHGALNLTSNTITLAGANAGAASGLTLTVSQWNRLVGGFNDVSLLTLVDSSNELSDTLILDGIASSDAFAAVKDTLTIDAGLITSRLAVNGQATGSVATLAAQTVVLRNTSGTASSVTAQGSTSGSIAFEANEIDVGEGNIYFDGFKTVSLSATQDVIFRGAGELSSSGVFRDNGILGTGGANLNITAALVATSACMESETGLASVYVAVNYEIDAGTGNVTLYSSGGSPGTPPTPGGTLAITGNSIDVYTAIEVPSGQIELTATNNITLEAGSKLLAMGYYASSTGAAVSTGAPAEPFH